MNVFVREDQLCRAVGERRHQLLHLLLLPMEVGMVARLVEDHHRHRTAAAQGQVVDMVRLSSQGRSTLKFPRRNRFCIEARVRDIDWSML
jgi:hypothetical protein